MNKLSQSTNQHIEELISQLADDYLNLLAEGEDPPIEYWIDKHPEAEDVIRRTIGAIRTMRLLDHDDDIWNTTDKEPVDPSRTIGDFRLIRIAGRGGMGIVYEAEQISLGRRVALKVLPFAAILDTRALQRFRNEVTAAAQLEHSNIVPIYGVGCDRSVHHYAMRFVEGVNLSEIIKQLRELRDNRKRFPDSFASISAQAKSQISSSETDSEEHSGISTGTTVGPHFADTTPTGTGSKSNDSKNWKHVQLPTHYFRSIARLAATVAEALDHAHQQGVTHRDIKPSNLMVDSSGKCWITDFGLAHVESGTALTMTGDLLGTARYMSPEQLMAKRLVLDHRTDIYSLGVTLYQLLTLELPFDSESRQELYRQIMMDEPLRPRKIHPAIPEDLETIVLKAIDKNPVHRYQTAQDMANDLHNYVQQKPIKARPASLGLKTRRWLQRNTAFVSGSLSVLFLSSIAMAIALVVLVTERSEKEAAVQRMSQERNQKNLALQNAQKEGQRATESFEYSLATLKEFLVEFANVDLSRSPGSERMRQSILRKASQHLATLKANHPERDHLRVEYADILYQLGGVSNAIGDFELANQALSECLAVRTALREKAPDEAARNQLDRGIMWTYLAKATSRISADSGLAEQCYKDAIKICGNLGGKNSQNADLAAARNSYGIFLSLKQRFEDSLTQYQMALERSSKMFRGAVLHNMAQVRNNQGDLAAALRLVDESIACPDQTVGWKMNHWNLKADLHHALHEFDQALAACEKGIRFTRRVARVRQRNLRVDWTLSGRGSKSTHAELLMNRLQLKAAIELERGEHYQAWIALQEAFAIHVLAAGVRLTDINQMKTRRDIEHTLAKAYEGMGHSSVAEFTRKNANKLEQDMQLMEPVSNGTTFAIGRNQHDYFENVAVANDGSIYAAGLAGKGTDFDPGPAVLTQTKNLGGAFVCKYAADGSIIWICSLGESVWGRAKSIALDADENVLVTGSLVWTEEQINEQTTARFGDITLKPPVLGNGDTNFVSKIDKAGNVLWARWCGRGRSCGIFREDAVATLPDGSIVVGGTLDSDSRFGFEESFIEILHPIGKPPRGYVASFAPDGVIKWARSIEANRNPDGSQSPRLEGSRIRGLASDASGNIYVSGDAQYLHSVVFGVGKDGKPFSLDDQQPGNERFGFLARLNANGVTNWVRVQTGSGRHFNYDVVADDKGQVYLLSEFSEELNLDGQHDYDSNLDIVAPFNPRFDDLSGIRDTSISCWDTDGRLRWQRRMAARKGYVSTYSLTPRNGGGVFAAGRITGYEFVFQEQRFPRVPELGWDGFALGINAHGKLVNKWFYTTGEVPSRIVPLTIAANRSNKVAVAGWFKDHVRAPTGEEIFGEIQKRDAFLTILDPAKNANEK